MNESMMKALAKAKARAEEYAKELEAVARDFARGDLGRDDLLLAAKKATNAEHAVGRAEKAASQ